MKHFYIKWVFTLALSALVALPALSQNKTTFWSKTNKESVSKKELNFRKTEPNKASFYQLDINALKTQLQAAPNRNAFSEVSNVIIDFPTAEGSFESYRIKEAPIMETALQNKYPDIRTYIGESINTPGTIIRFSITPQGLHTMSMSNNNGTQFIDPYSKNGNDYVVYAKKDLPALNQDWECGVVDAEAIYGDHDSEINMQRNADDGLLRNFRLVVATTIEYSSFHWLAAGLTAADTEAAKRAAVVAAIVVTINRNNQVYERDLSITMTLVSNNDTVVFIDTDNFSNDSASSLINESQTVIDAAIGTANYDIGHTFSTGGGGLAQLNSPCTGNKARGITGLPSPVGDAYDIDFVAHELGHQFGAPHTFNGDASNCAGTNRAATNAYEPGSGSTIMAYAGICAPQNVQGNSDAYFHQKSLQMIWDNVNSGNSQCAATTNTGNNAPTSNAGADFLIPISTPYKLIGSSTDMDGTGTHTYTWEQYDLGTAGLPLETSATGPMVRSFEGTSNTTRYIPRLEDLVSFNGSSTWEKLASIARGQNFRLTVRDNGVNGGQTAVDEMTATTTTSAGPFLVTSQNTSGISWVTGATETITWDVAGTTANSVNTANVNILLSTDGGLTYPTVLASNVANDGSEAIVVPSGITSATCRVMVEAVGNIFFNINTENFGINASTVTTCNVYSTGSISTAIPDSTGTDTQGSAIFIPITVTESTLITDLRIYANVTHPNVSDLVLQLQPPVGFANIWLRSCSTGQFQDLDITFKDGEQTTVCGNPTTGIYSPDSTMSGFDGTDPSGTWNLVFVDFNIGNAGVVNEWFVELCTTTSTELSVDEFSLESSFSAYPNPNNGDFNVKFNSPSNNVAISVFDIRGRTVYNKSYTNSGEFNENIKLGNVQSGLYLLNVNDGERTITKKIIVE